MSENYRTTPTWRLCSFARQWLPGFCQFNCESMTSPFIQNQLKLATVHRINTIK